jgi:branched-chain amino acid aminotransferase
LIIEKTKEFKEKPKENEELVFGKLKTDHMLEVDWNEKEGWATPKIVPYHSLELDPCNTTLHYAVLFIQ